VGAQEVIDLLVETVSAADDAVKPAEQAAQVAHEIEAVLMEQMEGNLGHVLLWEQFLRTPDEVASALRNVVESLMRADAELSAWLGDALARYRQADESG